jgi:hypothetical protein
MYQHIRIFPEIREDLITQRIGSKHNGMVFMIPGNSSHFESPCPLFINGKARDKKHSREIPAVDQSEACFGNLLDNRFTVRANVTRFIFKIDDDKFAVWAKSFVD